MTKAEHSNLGTRIRHLIELLDGDVAASYEAAGLGYYKPRYTPIFRSLIEHEVMTIKQITEQVKVSQPAITQTVNDMQKRGLITRIDGEDAREKKVKLTAQGVAMIPKLEAQWRATMAAATSLDNDLPNSLLATVEAAIEALQRTSFKQRMANDIVSEPQL